jgi:hypothetical protein
MRIASKIKEMSGESTSVIYSTCGINKTILCPGGFGIDCIIEEVLNSLDGHIKISVDGLHST